MISAEKIVFPCIVVLFIFIGAAQCKKSSSDKNTWFKVTKVHENVWQIDDNGIDNIYLVAGDKKALLIDTGTGSGNLSECVKKLTSLPLLVVNTHDHPDHSGGNNHFPEVYASAKETSLVDRGAKPVREGHIFDLGNRKLEVIEVPGHTPGSIVLLDAANRLLFSGDNNNTHVWLFLHNSLPVRAYVKSLRKLNRRNAEFTHILPGHGKDMDKAVLGKLVICAEKIITRKCKGAPYKQPYSPAAVSCEHDGMLIAFDPDKI